MLAKWVIGGLTVAMTAAPAMALTVKNTSASEITVAADNGTAELVRKIAPGASLELGDDCPNGCKVTGPWGFSWQGSKGDKLETDGKPMVTTTAPANWASMKPAAGAAAAVAATAAGAKAVTKASAKKKKRKKRN